jgi:hypothetical protein
MKNHHLSGKERGLLRAGQGRGNVASFQPSLHIILSYLLPLDQLKCSQTKKVKLKNDNAPFEIEMTVIAGTHITRPSINIIFIFMENISLYNY